MLDCFSGAGGDLGGVLDTGGGVDATGRLLINLPVGSSSSGSVSFSKSIISLWLVSECFFK